jgi:nicotinate-nucleotide adenylyltransferase
MKMPLKTLDGVLPSAPQGTRVGILGGSFDPPHLCHQLLALSTLALEPIDMLWIIPCGDHPFHKKMSSFEHRRQMCSLAFLRLGPEVHVVPIENYLPVPSYTVRTLENIHLLRPGIELFLTIGSDILEQMPNWLEPEKLENLSELIVYLREGFPIKKIPPLFQKIRIHDGYILPDIQSTHIRKDFKEPPSHPNLTLVDQKVFHYIQEQRLYQ